MSHYTMPNKYGKCTRDFQAFLFLLVFTFLYFGGVFNNVSYIAIARATGNEGVSVRYNWYIAFANAHIFPDDDHQTVEQKDKTKKLVADNPFHG